MTDRGGIAYAELATKQGIVTHTLTIEYHIIKGHLFQRLYLSQKLNTKKECQSLYSHA